MQKLLPLTALSAALVLAACGGKSTATSSGTATASGQHATTSPSDTAISDPSLSHPDAGTASPVTQAPSTPSTTPTAPTTTPTTPTTPVVTTPPVPTYSHEWYVAPSGSDTAEGSQSKPFRTIGRAISMVQAGERINVLAGDYPERIVLAGSVASGTATQRIALQGSGTPRILPHDSSWSMIDVEKPYWTIDGFEIDAQGANHAGVSFSTATTQGSVLSHSDVHNGIAGAAVSVSGSATGVTVDSNHIHDYWVTGQDAHGVLVEWTTRNTTITNNRIHNVSGDSVQCIGPETYADGATPADTVLIEGNDMSANGEQAVDIKTCSHVTIRQNVIHDFVDSSLPGGCPMVIHMSASDVLVEENQFTNAGKGLALGGNHVGPVPTNITIRKNRFTGMHTTNSDDGTAIRIANSNNVKVLNNTFSQIDGSALILGDGTGGNTSNLTVENNVFDAAAAVKLGGYADGLAFTRNLYRPGATFIAPAGSGPLATWQKNGWDKDAVSADPALSLDGKLSPSAAEIDRALDVGLPYCGAAPDLGAVESCP